MRNSKTVVIRLLLVTGMMLAIAGVVATSGAPPAPLPAPDWAGIFSPDGRVVDLKGGIDAIFMEEKFSGGVGLDMSVHPSPANRSIVDNGLVGAANDLGNGYIWATTDSTTGNRLIFAGVERLNWGSDTYVEFEFNQDVVQVHSGVPWQLHGGRTAGDLLARVNFVAGAISSAEISRWDGASFQTLIAAGPDGCSGVSFRYCSGAPPMQSFQDESWDAAGNHVQVPQADSFVDVGVDVAALLGSDVDFTSIQVRTPEDVILDSFRHFGFWANRGHGGND